MENSLVLTAYLQRKRQIFYKYSIYLRVTLNKKEAYFQLF